MTINRITRWQLFLLGANVAWLGAFWPLLTADRADTIALCAALCCPLALLFGTLAKARLALLGQVSLLIVFPGLIATTLASLPQATVEQVLPLPILALLSLSLCVYGIAALLVLEPQEDAIDVAHHALNESSIATSKPSWKRRALLITYTTGALSLVLLAPNLGDRAALEAVWGESADAGGLLAAVVGIALGTASLAVFLGGTLVRRLPTPRSQADLRAFRYLCLTILGATTYFVINF